MSANYRPEPEADHNFGITREDWDEMSQHYSDWQAQWQAEEDRYWEERAFDELNMELIAVSSP